MSQLQYDEIICNISSYVHGYKVQSSKAWDNAKTALLDAIGCAIETYANSAEAARFVGPVVPGTSVPNGFRLPGTKFELDPLKGAFDLGSLIRYLDHNDAYPGAEWGHPSDNLGAILAVADWRCRSLRAAGRYAVMTSPLMSVRTVLEALIKAYEIQGIFQAKNAFNGVGLDHTILVKIASTAVVCYLLGLDEAATRSALSHAWADGHPLRLFRQAPNTGPRKGWAAGDACMRAVHLAFLAEKGQPGLPTAITDPSWGFSKTLFAGKDLVLPRPFGTAVIESIFFKLVAAEGHGISAVEAALQLSTKLREMNIDDPASEIEKIKIRTQKPAMTIIDKRGPLRNAADRDHCMQYMVAVTLLKQDWIEAQDYEDSSPWATHEGVESLRDRTEMVEDEQFTKDYYDARKRSGSSGVKLFLKDGREVEESVVEWPIGHPWRADTNAAVKEKLVKNLRLGFSQGEVDEILKVTGADTFLELPISDFLDLFWKGRE